MTGKEISLLAIIVTSFLTLLMIAYYIYWKRARKRASGAIFYKKNKKNRFYYLYRFYSSFPIFKGLFKKVKTRLASLYPADPLAINIKATNYFTSALLISSFIGIIIIIISRGDVFYLGIGLVMIYVILTQLINMRLESLELKLDEAFTDFISDVRHFYHDTNDVADAVYCTLDSLPFEMELHAQKIYQVLIDVNITQAVDKYEDSAPNRFLKTFAAICATIKEYGDKRLEDGQWMFLKNLNYLKEEVNIEILKIRKNNYLFSGLKFIAVTPMFLLKPIELWATANMPDMAEFYTGPGGTITMATTFALVMFSYTMVGKLKDGRTDEFKEYKIIPKIESLPFLRGLLTAEINRNYSKSLRIGDNLKMVGEKLTPRQFLLKRVIYAIVFFIVANVIVIVAESRARQALIEDFSSTFESSIVPNAEYRENMRAIAAQYTTQEINAKEEDKMSPEQLEDQLVAQEGIKRNYARQIVEEITERQLNYGDIYYRWYYLVLTIASAVLGFSVPYLILKYQVSIMKMNMEDEVIQYQTLALILMHVGGITVDILLEWMERFAFCFKDSISTCIINLEYSIQDALTKMKDTEPFPPFKRYVDNILAIDNVGMESAFDEIATEREYYQKKREQDNEIIINKKASRGKIIAFIPLIGAIGGHMILPFMMMAIDMMGTMTEAIQSIK